ncbi:MAG: hypothetical protein KME20_09820 [Kaiparowitsia implicata GSE-PSE-MK54-09C]|nr:hypothetical protein [Kaiparowitsia implicata GSE-PSE-MK54-09C]
MKKLSPRIIYPVTAGALILAGAAFWLLTRFEVAVEVDPFPAAPEAIAPTDNRAASRAARDPSLEADKLPMDAPPTPALPPPLELSTATPGVGVAATANLRVSNQTDHPVRVALLVQRAATGESAEGTIAYQEPVHWDFAPQEGSATGLKLALPSSGDLLVRNGDVVVAFAQDGSRRYWGPLVVGATSSPRWQEPEWVLILR